MSERSPRTRGDASDAAVRNPRGVPLPVSRHCACAVFMSAYFVSPPRSRRRTSVRCLRSAVAGDSIARPYTADGASRHVS